MSHAEPRVVDMPFPVYYAGLDLGRLADFSALAVLEARDFGPERRYDVRGLMRAPRGKAYPELVSAVRALVASDELRPFRRHPADWRGTRVERSPDPYLIVDATGVGVAVVD